MSKKFSALVLAAGSRSIGDRVKDAVVIDGTALVRRTVDALSAAGALRSAWGGLGAVVGFMGLAAIGFLTGGALIMSVFSDDPRGVDLGAQLLMIAAAFQLVDGAQAVASGALRGAGDTIRPLIAHLIGHWAVAIPVGATAAFGFGLGVEQGAKAIWWGLACGLAVAAALLVVRIPRIGRTRPLD